MKAPRPPRIDERRAPEFLAGLEERARAWIPSWGLADGEHDFGRALLEIAARFNSEVAERLDGAGEKMRRGFLDWLAVSGQAARPARMPVVFKLADTAREGVLASAPVRMQADAGGTPVVFETEADVRVVPGRLEVLVGVDAERDAFYLPPPGLNDLKPLEPLPTEWQLKSFAAAGATNFQLDPEAGLVADTVIEAAGQQYRIVKADKDLVTIDRPLGAGLAEGSAVTKVTTFSPFGGRTHNQQQHALYLGDSELLNVEAAATIEVVGASALREGFAWEYWGKVDKVDGDDEEKWRPLTLAENQKAAAVVLNKTKGAITPHEVAGVNSRWIRGTTQKLEAPAQPFSVDALKLRVNCLDGGVPCPTPETVAPESATPGPAAEAMVNTTPLVLSEPFYPLGREPRQFDAFYLGSSEAFSKKGATAQLCFEMSDATCRSYSALRTGPLANQILAGIGKDRALHLFKLTAAGVMTAFRSPLRPPFPADAGGQADQSASASLNRLCRPVIWSGGPGLNDFFVAVAAGRAIWIWHESASSPQLSGWKLHSTVPAGADPAAQVDDIVVLKGPPEQPGAVLSGRRFLVFQDSTWVEPNLPQPLRDYASLAAIHHPVTLEPTDSMVAVSLQNEIYRLEAVGTETLIGSIDSPGTPVSSVRPAAIDSPLRVVAVAVKPDGSDEGDELVGILEGSAPVRMSLRAKTHAMGAAIAIHYFGLVFLVGSKDESGAGFVTTWLPFNGPNWLFESPFPDASRTLDGTPLVVNQNLVVPGGRGDAFVAQFDVGRLKLFTRTVVEALIVPDIPRFGPGDFLSALFQGVQPPRLGWSINKAASEHNGETLYLVDPALGEYVTDDQNGPQFIGYLASDDHTGVIDSATEFTPDPGGFTIEPDMILRVSADDAPGAIAFCEVDSLNGTKVVIKTSSPPLPANTGTLTYWKPTSAVARAVPAIEFLSPLGDANWETLLRDYPNIYFDLSPALRPEPSPQRATAFATPGNPPKVAALEKRWTANPPALNAPTEGFIDGTIDNWRHQLADSSSNPALSWEYWNGKGWWSLEILQDRTERLATTGSIKFKVPRDIAESDWAGKTNFWIRARLVGGDYGHEEVKVIIKPGIKTGETEQVIERSSANIRAPQVLDLRLSYSICTEVLPKFVVAEDSGTMRDQSDANRTQGAIVEAFVPLALTLGRLTKTGAATAPTTTRQDCPPECDCATLRPGKSEPSSLTTTTAAAGATRVTGREIYIGLSARLSEAPVNVLLLVNESPYTDFAPMRIEALAADRFVPIVADDATRALGESGVLSMTFAIPPTPSELFGRTLTWLRLIPKRANDEWTPTLRGAYLNAAWASATETLTRELLGSSDGAPNLTVFLARPPVLRQTLELRVREPLGEEEREALLKQDAKSVLSTVEGLPGDWVLWKQVTDPDDEPAAARIYALDETGGEIRFGDGRHGRIPPIGRDSIVAFSYARTEPDPAGGDRVPGNTIAARTSLNLVSPVETVESTTAADQAAGGAPPESDERVLRFGFARLRHRSRAVTAEDLEDLALQSSPDIVQARAFVRRGFIRLVVVMHGKEPVPNAAQIRELRRLLLAAAPASLSAPGALRVEGPRIRRLRIELTLLLETLDRAGEVSTVVKKKLADFFDTGTGGVDKDGWQLAAHPSEEDIALAISDTPYLEAIKNVELHEITRDGNELPTLAAPGSREIVMLAEDPIRIQFETAEVMV